MNEIGIEYVTIDEIKPYPGNAKEHPAEQVEQIKQSIKEFGFNDPIAVDKGGEIIEGHGRYIAAKELGVKTVPIIRLSELGEAAKKAYALVHNKLTMNTGFDYDVMTEELESLTGDMGQYGFDLADEEASYTIENREYSPDDFEDEKFRYECPDCGFRFNA